MNAAEFINYSKKRNVPPDDEVSVFDTLAAMMKNRFGSEFDSIIAEEDAGAVGEILSDYGRVTRALKDCDTRIEIADARDTDLQEKIWIVKGAAVFAEKESLDHELESAAEKLTIPGSSGTISTIIESISNRFGAGLKDIIDSENELHDASVPDIVRNIIRELQKKIRCTLCARLRFCSGKVKYPKMIWSSSRQVKYFLDIIQENESSRNFTFVLYADEPLGTGRLIVRTEKKILKSFAFRNEKRRYRDFTYNGRIAETNELYFIIKEI